MKHESLRSGKRKPVNLSIDTGVIEAARALEINLSQVCETALRTAIAAERSRKWQEEHREAIEANNAWVEKHGLPLAKYRMF